MIDGQAFVTPHAVRAFQARVAPLPYAAARAAILDGLAEHMVRACPARDGAVRVRVRHGPYPFRAVLAADPRGRAPVVVTIERSGR